ncbi:hypothetical protein AB4144_22120 [Rhizobiaceae sp. 2RAB30]
MSGLDYSQDRVFGSRGDPVTGRLREIQELFAADNWSASGASRRWKLYVARARS